MSRIDQDVWSAYLARPGEESFRPLYEGTKGLVWTLCVRILGDHEAAEDAFQSTYCRILAEARDPRLSREVTDPVAAACKAAIREADRLRKRRGRRRERELPLPETQAMRQEEPTGDEAVDEIIARRETRERVEALVAALPDAYRLPVQLHFLNGLSQREVARALGEPLATVSDRIRSALRQLAPAFRRAGLGQAAAVLAAIAATGTLFQPPLSAGVIYSLAHAAVVSSVASVLESKSTIASGTLAGGVIAVKTKALIAALVIVATLIAIFAVREIRTRRPPAEEALARTVLPAKDALRPDAIRPPGGEAAAGKAAIAARVVWLGTAEPVRSAKVALSAGQGAPATLEAETADDGAVTFDTPAGWGSAWIEARHPEGIAAGKLVSLPAEEPVAISLVRDVITGIVLDSETGGALPGASIRAGEREAIADGSGAYLLAGLGQGQHRLVAGAEGHANHPAQANHAPPAESVVDFRLDPAISVVVRVADEKGAPLTGANVVPSVFGSEGIFHGDEAVVTDSGGIARLLKVSRSRPPVISVARDGYKNAYAKVPPGQTAEELEVTVVLEEAEENPRAIAGKVTDAAGKPIAGAVIEWKDGAGTSFGSGAVYGQFRATTGRDGRYRLELTDDFATCELGVAARGWAPLVAGGVKPGTPEAPAERDFVLEPGHWLGGRVLDGSGRPLARTRVTVMPSTGLLNAAVAYPAVLRRTETDGEGRFHLEDLPGPTAGIEIRPRGGIPPLEEEIAVDREAEWVLKGYGVIRGRVVDEKSGEAIQAFRVRLRGSVTAQQWDPGESFTPLDGRFVIKQLDPNQKFGIVVEAEGYPAARIDDLTPQIERESDEHVVKLGRGRAVEGVVVDAASGTPLAGAEVALTTLETAVDLLTAESWKSYPKMFDFEYRVTGEDGKFLLAERAAGRLLVRAPGRRKLFLQPEGRAAFLGPKGRLRIPLERGEVLRGVCHEAGRPARGIKTHLMTVDSVGEAGASSAAEPAREATTDGEGRFAWDDLSPGAYLLEVEHDPGEPHESFRVLERRRVDVKPGEATTVEMGKDLGSLALHGRLRGLERDITMWAWIVLRPTGNDGGPELAMKTYRSWDFRYACPYLRPGSYKVEVLVYGKEGDRSFALPPLEVTEDGERDLQVAASGG